MNQVSIPSGANLTALYREMVGDYPKFFKMDTLCRLGFLLMEMLLKDEAGRFTPREDRSVLIFSRNGCLANDLDYAKSMEEDFPSPALFVYTLPNTVAGEIAIRNKYEGETSTYVLEEFDRAVIDSVVRQAFQDDITRDAIVAWIDCPDSENWTACAWIETK